MSGITARIGENRVDFMVLLAACMVEREEMRKKKPRRERKGSGEGGCRDREGGERRKGFAKLQKCPSLFHFCPKLFDT